MKKLERRLGLLSVVVISLSAMLGSGLFVLPGLVVAKTGPSVWLAYLLAAVCVLPAALSKSELATAMPFSGGTYIYLERCFGPLVGTVAGLGLWSSFLLKSSFALVGFSAYLEILTGGPTIPIKLMAELLLLGIIVINVFGTRAISKIQLVVVMLSLIGLAALAFLGMRSADQPMTPFLDHGTSGLLGAAAFVFVAYAGVTKVAAIAEEVKEPTRNLPLGILLALLISSAIYASVTYVIVANVPVDRLAGDLRPVHTFAETVAGPQVGMAAAAVAVATMVSMALAGVMASSRFLFAMGRDRLLPDAQAALSPTFGTPVNAIMVTGLAMGAAIATLDVEKIAKLASGFKIMIFIAINISVILLREARAQWYQPGFKSPLYPLTQIVGVLTGVGLLCVMGPTALLGAGALVVVGTVFYLCYGRHYATHLGLLQRIGSRKDLLAPAGLVGATPLGTPLGTPLAGAPGTADSEGELPEAEVAIPIFGWEVTPDALVEVGASLVEEGDKIEVLRIAEVATHTSLGEAAEANEDEVAALERRIERLAGELQVDVHFDSVWTRDMRQSVHEYAARAHCKWIVMEYIASARRGAFLRDPFAWLLTHLPCNLALFKDAGGHHGRRIMVSIEPGPHDALVVNTAARLARAHQAELTFYRALSEQAPPWELEAAVDYHEQLGQLVDVASESVVIRHPRPISAVIQATADYDLLVTGAPRERGMWGMFFGEEKDRIMEQAVCSVLRLKTPRKETHRLGAPSAADAGPFDLRSYLRPELIAAACPVAGKKELFRRIGALYAEAGKGEAAAIEEALWKREQLQNTDIGDGIAIPHATMPGALDTELAILTMATPLDYLSGGSQPVSLVFVTVGPPSDRATHLQLLSELSRLLVQTDLRHQLAAAGDTDAVIADVEAALAQLSNS